MANICIHSDAAAASVADGIGSSAFTFGSDIVLNRGEYQMATLVGQAGLTHELTHAIQNQRFGHRSSGLGVRSRCDRGRQDSSEERLEKTRGREAGSHDGGVDTMGSDGLLRYGFLPVTSALKMQSQAARDQKR